MTRDEATDVITAVIGEIQEGLGHEGSKISDDLCPLRDLEEFDSLIAVVATGYVAARSDQDIPDGVNLFVEKNRPLTLAEAADKLYATLAGAEKTR